MSQSKIEPTSMVPKTWPWNVRSAVWPTVVRLVDGDRRSACRDGEGALGDEAVDGLGARRGRA
ncbi:MAG: hypothetical protein R3F34_03860 [Planctomycetota bacterium]